MSSSSVLAFNNIVRSESSLVVNTQQLNSILAVNVKQNSLVSETASGAIAREHVAS